MWVVAFDSADSSSVSWVAFAFPCASASLALWHEFLQSVFPLPPSPLVHLAVPEYMLLIRSSLCWVSHWANCCFAQAFRAAASLLSPAISPPPLGNFYGFFCELLLEQLWAIGFSNPTSVKFWFGDKAGGGLMLVLSNRFCRIPLL